MIGYGIFSKEQICTHRVCDIDYYPMVIFKTLKEAQDYSIHTQIIKKVRINVNKTNLNIYYNNPFNE